MKLSLYKCLGVALLLTLPLLAHAAPPKNTASKATNSVPTENLKSTFVIPKSPKEGRDPFFPKATSIYGSAGVTNVATAAPVLKLRGFLGTSYAQINNITLGVGETQEVKTAGGPVSVHLIEIRLRDETVIIEVNGQRQELSLGRGGLTPR